MIFGPVCRIAFAALTALAATTALGLGQAQAQVQFRIDDGYDRSPRGRSPYGDDRPRAYDRYDGYARPYEDGERRPVQQQRYGRQRMGSVCVTARGNCPAYPSPIQSPCRCDIPGFGPKRGNVLE
ncbi:MULTISPECIES: hypothetical protein [unclassified Methylobacterium]|uniref:hypothetical protein n=1 Tax=unclassified Methylobacterium TaxID=2615210 RepID=UPI0006FDF6E8|nr:MULTISPECIES: hypothetical protein [unclassified Methylobacterium]KQO49084.1 hypothetical protein ASF24_07770 [Methylobacterium sp. Leaf86]KQP00683.1 hypothetical protein ASF32_02125 [Methylobacterium sp. Leaf91]